MTAHAHHFTSAPVAYQARADIAAFLATLQPNDPLYWPAMAAADGCDASLVELNELLDADGCFGFAAAAQSPVGMAGEWA